MASARMPASPSAAPTRDGSSGGLISSVVSDAQRLITLEVALARQEAKELATTNGVAVAVIAAGGLMAVLGVLVALPAMVVELVPWHWQAAAVWAAVYVVLGGLLIFAGKARLKVGLPRRTLDTLKENKEWALRRVRSNGR